MVKEQIFYPETRINGFSDIDGTVTFYNRVNSLIKPTFTIVDFGCGRGEYVDDTVLYRKNLRVLKGKVAKVIGLDIDSAARNNPFIDEFYQTKNYSWNVQSDSADMIICDNVMEHIEEPDKVLAEFQRILKNSGYLCIRTTNRWSYIGLLASLIPQRYHGNILAVAQERRKEEDVFKAAYRCNSIRQLKRIMTHFNFDSVVYGYEAEPSYLSFSVVAYFLGVLHQRFAPKMIKPTIFAFGVLHK